MIKASLSFRLFFGGIAHEGDYSLGQEEKERGRQQVMKDDGRKQNVATNTPLSDIANKNWTTDYLNFLLVRDVKRK